MMNLNVYPHESIRMQAGSSIRQKKILTFIFSPQCQDSIVDDYGFYTLKNSMQITQARGLQAGIPN